MTKVKDNVLRVKKEMISQYKNRNKMTRVKNREKIREIWDKLDENEKDILRRELVRGTKGLEITVKFVATVFSMILGVIALVINISTGMAQTPGYGKEDYFVMGTMLISVMLFIALYYLSGLISMKMKLESEYLLDMIGEEYNADCEK